MITWERLTQADFVTTEWSGGTTTQLAISPERAAYGDREFLWRLSSATVELDHSDFTPLPDYDRLLSVLKGNIQLKIGGAEPMELEPGRVAAFDGGVPVESWGRCVDFNLMVRKGTGRGFLTELRYEEPCEQTIQPGVKTRVHGLYCVSGRVRLPEFGLEAGAGELLLCRDAQGQAVRLESGPGVVIAAAIREA